MLHDLWAWHPPVGVYIGILGFLGLLVALTRDPTTIRSREKAAWIFVMFVLLLLEVKSVYQDRNEHDEQQAEARERETKSFESIANGIEGAIQQSQKDFAASMRKSDAIMGGVTDSIRIQTGGDSFAYITFTPEPGPYFLVSITSRGRYPLKEIHATMVDYDQQLKAMVEYTKHPSGDWTNVVNAGETRYEYPYLRPSGDVELLGMHPFPRGDSNRVIIAFSSLNGYWNEVLHLNQVNGTWHQCLSVMGPTVKQATKPFIYCDSDWPEGKASAEKDWARTTQKAD